MSKAEANEGNKSYLKVSLWCDRIQFFTFSKIPTKNEYIYVF